MQAATTEVTSGPAVKQPGVFFEVANGAVRRTVLRRDGSASSTELPEMPSPHSAEDAFDAAFLRSLERPAWLERGDHIRFVDLFSGCGSLSLGVMDAVGALGLGATCALAADIDQPALDVLTSSLDVPPAAARPFDLAKALDGEIGSKRTRSEAEVTRNLGEIDAVIAGPPCQGHSRLNNHSRHDDDRNDLYLRVTRFAELCRPEFVLIENVASVRHDRRNVVAQSAEHLARLGYHVDEGLVDLHSLGVPQTRTRHVLVASPDSRPIDVDSVVQEYAVKTPSRRNVAWAIDDLSRDDGGGFDAPAKQSEENQQRIAWLHEDDARTDLPNKLRPPCHHGDHSYKSMYGKLRWDIPAQTLTSGYSSMGQGRYVHPTQRRTLTPHEAARLQYIPDFFKFDVVSKRGAWATMIGNAAPMKLSYVFALAMFR